MNEEKQECNISFFLEEENTKLITDKNSSLLFEELYFEEPNNIFDLDLNLFSFYEKLTCSELLKICDYYEIAKEAKTKKYKKAQLVFLIVNFESNTDYVNIVYQRKNMWFYINELKNDRKMKKYVLW